MSKLMRLHPIDTVLVIREPIQSGDKIAVEGVTVEFNKPLGFGHKIAACFIARGAQIFKFGVPIGSATQDIQLGEHVHLHNIKSDYLTTYTKENEFTGK